MRTDSPFGVHLTILLVFRTKELNIHNKIISVYQIKSKKFNLRNASIKTQGNILFT